MTDELTEKVALAIEHSDPLLDGWREGGAPIITGEVANAAIVAVLKETKSAILDYRWSQEWPLGNDSDVSEMTVAGIEANIDSLLARYEGGQK